MFSKTGQEPNTLEITSEVAKQWKILPDTAKVKYQSQYQANKKKKIEATLRTRAITSNHDNKLTVTESKEPEPTSLRVHHVVTVPNLVHNKRQQQNIIIENEEQFNNVFELDIVAKLVNNVRTAMSNIRKSEEDTGSPLLRRLQTEINILWSYLSGCNS